MSRSRLSEDEKAQILAEYCAGSTSGAVGKRHECSDRTVMRIAEARLTPEELEKCKKQNRKQSSTKPTRCDKEKSHPAPVQIPGKEYIQSSCTFSNDKEKGACLKLREDLRKCLQEFESEANKQREYCLRSERQTESLLVEPYLEILGINTKNPEQLRRQYPTFKGKDAGIVDYAVLHEGHPIWLIEVKRAEDNLPDQLPVQLKRYIVETEAPFASLTNGIHWHWYKWNNNEKKEARGNSFSQK